MHSFPLEPFTLRDLEPLGISERSLRTALTNREVRRLFRGVFVPVEIADTLDLRAKAAAQVVAKGHVMCDRSAAWLHGVEILRGAELEVPPRVETCALRWKPRSRLDGVRGRNRDLIAEDICEIGGVLVTTPVRTALDLGCNLVRRDALAALDQFGRVHHVTPTELIASLPRFRGRRGVVQLRELIGLMDPASESVRESWTRIEIRDAGLPAPVLQFWIDVDGVPTYRLDLAYPASRVAVEYDGDEFHRTLEQREHDRRRRDYLRRQGWTVIVVRNGDFTGDRLLRWLRELRSELNQRRDNLRW